MVEQRVQELNRLDKGVSFGVAKSTKRHIAWLDKEIAQLDKEYQEALQSSAPLARLAALYRTVPGVGPLTAAILVAHLPELGHWDSKALTSLVGLAPWSRDSGQKRGQRAIRGGRGIVRKALCWPGPGPVGPDPATRRSPSTSIPPSARPTDWPRRAPATTAIPASGATSVHVQ